MTRPPQKRRIARYTRTSKRHREGRNKYLGMHFFQVLFQLHRDDSIIVQRTMPTLALSAVAHPRVARSSPRRVGVVTRCGPVRNDLTKTKVSRRAALVLAGVVGVVPSISSPSPSYAIDLASYAVSGRDDLDIHVVDTSGWQELDSGVRFEVLQTSEGNIARGITDPVSYYIPNPFVEVKYTAYVASTGKAFASSEQARRPYNFQAGVKDEVQDEPGGIPEMKVGEKRRFTVPAELCFKRRVFGLPAPKDVDILIDVELLALQPY